MNVQEFAAKVKSKYPQYANLPDEDLARRVVQKHPEYSSQVDFAQQPTMFGMAKQAIGETLREPLPFVGKEVERLRNAPIDPFDPMTGIQQRIGGQLLPKTGLDLALSGTGPALGLAGEGLSKGVVPAVRSVLPKLTEALTSIEGPIVERAIQRTAQVGKKLSGVLDSDVAEMAVNRLKDAVKAARRAVGQRLGAIEDIVAQKNTVGVQVNDLGDELAQKLSNAGYRIKGYTNSEVSSKLGKETGEILNDFRKGDPLSFKGALTLRRKIDRLVEFQPQGGMKVGSTDSAILKDIRSKLNERLLASDPVFKKANDAFAKVAENYRVLEKDILSGKEETVSNRIARIFRKGSIERKVLEKVDAIGHQASGQLDDLLDTLTAQMFKPRVNPGMTRAVKNTGGGLAARAMELGGLAGIEGAASHFGHPMALPGTVGATALATSPRLNFRVIQAAKAISKILNGLSLGPKSELALSLTAPKLHDAILNHAMESHLNDSQNAP